MNYLNAFELLAAVKDGKPVSDLYGLAADMIAQSMAGQSTGLTRDQILDHIRQHCPDEATLRATLARTFDQARTIFGEAPGGLQ